MANWNQADKASPDLRPRLGLLSKPTTPQQQLQAGYFAGATSWTGVPSTLVFSPCLLASFRS